MPYSLNIHLDAHAAEWLPDNANVALHATFFKWLEASDKALAQSIHSATGLKPFTVSPLTVTNGRAEFRIALLDDALYPAIRDGMSKRPYAEIVHAVLPVAGEPRVTHHSYEQLVDRAWEDDIVTLRFESPASSRSNGMHFPLPDPILVFGSYLARWNTFAPPELRVDESWLEWLRQAVAVARFRIDTEEVRFPDYQQIGCVGLVQYRIVRPDRSLPRAIAPFNFLADYAFFCGTGHMTTRGMGQTRRLRRWPAHATPQPAHEDVTMLAQPG
jgi:CRISPR-associated endoribonuclease Cas6